MSENNHLPLYGIGPYVIGAIALMTIMAIMISFLKYIPAYASDSIILRVFGIILMVVGAAFWLLAVFKSDIQKNIEQNHLLTAGIYGVVRHPIYAAFLYAITGMLLIADNLILMPLSLVYWLILTLTIVKTEEKWLIDLYGDDYLRYSKKVNRFIPKVIQWDFLRIWEIHKEN